MHLPINFSLQLNNTLQGIKRKAAQPPAAAPPLKKTAAPPSDVPSKKPTNIPAKPVKIKGKRLSVFITDFFCLLIDLLLLLDSGGGGGQVFGMCGAAEEKIKLEAIWEAFVTSRSFVFF